MKTNTSPKTTRRGFSALEFQVALALLGVALVGMVPLVVMQMKQLKLMENRWDPDWTAEEAAADYWIDPYRSVDDGPVYYLVPPEVSGCPQANPWARKLGAPAQIVAQAADDTPPTRSGGTNGSEAIVSIDASDTVVTITNEEASATVTVTPIED